MGRRGTKATAQVQQHFLRLPIFICVSSGHLVLVRPAVKEDGGALFNPFSKVGPPHFPGQRNLILTVTPSLRLGQRVTRSTVLW